VGQYQKIFRGVDQQDSHEFLTILMDWLHEKASMMWKRQAAEGDGLNATEGQELHFRILQLESKAQDYVRSTDHLIFQN